MSLQVNGKEMVESLENSVHSTAIIKKSSARIRLGEMSDMDFDSRMLTVDVLSFYAA
jgi:hypothetical protein